MFFALLSLLPILLILLLMVVFHWGAAQAGAAGYLCALVIGVMFFGASPRLVAYAHAKAFFLCLDVLMIIWAAFLLYRVVDEAGAILMISQSLPHLTPDKGIQVLIIGFVFAAFLQGVGGFGVPVAVIAPILVSLGFSPLSAVIIPSIGHGWSVTFGSLGTSFLALLSTTGQSAESLGPPAAAMLGIAAIFTGPMVLHAAGGWGVLRRGLAAALLLGAVMAVIQYVVVRAGLWYLGAFIASLVGLLISFPIALRTRPNHRNENPLDLKALLVALSGYIILIALTLAIQLIPQVKELLSSIKISVEFPEIRTSLGYVTPSSASRPIYLLRHPGMTLLYASTLAYLIYHRAGHYDNQGGSRIDSIIRILEGTMRRVMPSSLSIAFMVTMSVVMELSGMTEALAQGLAQGIGGLYPLVAPWIGALGAFMTGSNTNANVLFGALQLQTAELLGLTVPIILAAQTAGAAIASVLAPTKVVVGTSTTGMVGKEGDIIKRLVISTALLLLLISLLTLSSVQL